MLKSLTKREFFLAAIIIVLIVAIVVFIIILVSAPKQSIPTTTLPSATESTTRQPIAGKVAVPEVNSSESGFAIPNLVVAAAPYGSAKARSFSIAIANNQFSPAKIAVNQGDNVSIFFTAKDKNYDVAIPDYGLKQIIPKGESEPIMFQATAAGQFTFDCPSCGGPTKGPVGYLFVVSK